MRRKPSAGSLDRHFATAAAFYGADTSRRRCCSIHRALGEPRDLAPEAGRQAALDDSYCSSSYSRGPSW
jgi:hypothetical protein